MMMDIYPLLGLAYRRRQLTALAVARLSWLSRLPDADVRRAGLPAT